MSFSKTEVARMRAVQTAHMADACLIYRMTGKVKDSRGIYVEAFAEAEPSVCGAELQPAASSDSGKVAIVGIDAVLRLPAGIEVKPGDEIELTERFGEAITPQRYEVDRYINAGISGGRAYLKAKAVK